jgi:hypothetical protein
MNVDWIANSYGKAVLTVINADGDIAMVSVYSRE